MKKITLLTGMMIVAVFCSSVFASQSMQKPMELAHFSPQKTYFDEVRLFQSIQIDDERTAYISPFDMDSVEITEPDNTAYRRPGQSWRLTDTEQVQIAQWYREAMVKRLEKAGLTIVDTPNDASLIISSVLTGLAPTAPKDDASRRPNETYYTESAGSAKVSITVKQGANVVMEIADQREMGNRWQKNDAMRNGYELRRLLASWANSLIRQLEV